VQGESTSAKGLAEETLFPQGPTPGAPLRPRLLAVRPFLWLVLAVGVVNLALWALLGAMWADAAFTFHANQAQMSVLLASFSLPLVLTVPFQGILVDRWSPKWMFCLGMLFGIAAVPVAWFGNSLHWLYASSFLLGAGVGTMSPARSSLTGLLVDEEHLVQANGMLSGAMMLALVIGPFTGGILLRTSGTSVLYPAVMVVAGIALFLSLLVPDRRQGGERPSLTLRELADGIVVSWRRSELRLLMWLSIVAWLMVNVYWILEPLFVKGSLHLGRDAVQFIWAAQGLGAVVGSFLLYRLETGTGRELLLVGLGLAGTGAGLMLFALIPTYPVALVGMIVHGLGFSLYFASSLALIQRLAGEEKRGRVTSFFTVIQEGSAIVVALIVVTLGDLVVVRPSIAVSGAILVAAGAFGLLRLSGRLRGPVLEGSVSR
jgi:MFS family permease